MYVYIYIYIYIHTYIYFFNSNTAVFIYFRLYRLCFNLAVPFHIQENPIELFKENVDIKSNHLLALKCRDFVDDNSFPMILEENKFMLTIKNMSIAKTKDFVMAFALLLCSHHVFNLSYSRNLVSSMAFFQKHIIKLLDDIGTSAKTLGFISKIRKTGLLSF